MVSNRIIGDDKLILQYIAMLLTYKSISERVELYNLNSKDMQKEVCDEWKFLCDKYSDLDSILGLEDVKNMNEITIHELYLNISKELELSSFEMILDELIDMYLHKSNELFMQSSNSINFIIANIIRPVNGRILDPTCGVGRTLSVCYEQSLNQNGSMEVVGQELNGINRALTICRFMIKGVEKFQIYSGSSLTKPKFLSVSNQSQKFDYVVADPPYGIRWNTERDVIENNKELIFNYGLPPISSADWLFASLVLDSLNEKGKGVIVLPNGSLFRTSSEREIRKRMIDSDYIETIIGLPARINSYTSVPVVLVIFNKSKEEHMKNKIQFIDASGMGMQEKSQTVLDENELKEITRLYKLKEDIDDLCSVKNIKELDDYNLLPSKNINKTKYTTSDGKKIKMDLKKLQNTISLEKVCSIHRGVNIVSKIEESADGEYSIIRSSNIHNNELDISSVKKYSIESNTDVEKYKVKENDILLTIRGETKVVLVNKQMEGMLISQDFVYLRTSNNFNSELLREYLLSPVGEYLLNQCKAGTTIEMVNIKELKNLKVIKLNSRKQNEIMECYNRVKVELDSQIEQINMKKIENIKNLYENMKIDEVFKEYKE